MTVLERIKETAREKKNISLTVLEQELGYSNGSLAKVKDIPSGRIMEISNYLNVSMNYLMTGKESEFSIEMANKDLALSNMSKRIKDYALILNQMPAEQQEHIISLIDMLNKSNQ